MVHRCIVVAATVVSALTFAPISHASAQDAAAFYKGKSLRLVISNDVYSAVLARQIFNEAHGENGVSYVEGDSRQADANSAIVPK